MRFPLRFLLGACLCATAASTVSAAVIYETDFTTNTGGAPFNAANLQFQDGWLGQNLTFVDPSGDGVANTGATTTFPRNLNNRGALGNQAGGPGGPGEIAGPGFTAGDKIRITAEYSFELDARTNEQLAQIGVDNKFSSPGGGFNATPLIGMKMFYSEFQSSSGGALKLYGNFARNEFSGADNAFALITSGLSIGLDPDGVSGPVDLVSDFVEVSLEMAYLGADEWQTTDLTLANATTGTPLLSAAADKPAILAEVQTIDSSNDLFMAVQWMRNEIPNSSFDSFRYEYFAIPEPTTALLLGVASLGVVGRGRRS